MKKQIFRGLSAVMVMVLLIALWPGMVMPARAEIEPPLNWNLKLTADKSVISPGDTVNFTASFNLISGVLSGYSKTRLTVYLPAGLDYVRATLFTGGEPAILAIVPAVTPLGTSLIIDLDSVTTFAGEVQLRIATTVSKTWNDSMLIVRSNLYLQPFGGIMPNTPHDEAAFLIRSLITVTPSIYTVWFDLAGGFRVGGGALVQAVPGGGSAVEPYVYRDGYIFLGWDQPFYNVTQDLVVRALWTSDVPDIVDPPPYGLVDGWFAYDDMFTHFSHMPMMYLADYHSAYVTSVVIDGHILTDRNHYMVTSGTNSRTTAIHLKASYLNNLTSGTHTLRVNFWDGMYSEAYFTVKEYHNPFYDVSWYDWYYEGVEAMHASGLMQGISTTQYGPETHLSRAMVVTLLYRFAGEPSIAGFRNPFPDVTSGMWYTNAVIWAAANGIVMGYPSGLFGPFDDMTHEQFATVLYRYQNAIGSRTADMPYREYTDYSQISLYARAAVYKMTMQGVFRDLPTIAQNDFKPQISVNRAEVAAVMRRWIESIGW